jgi:hypothetical protein
MQSSRWLRQRPSVESLEARVLYSADPASAVFEVMTVMAPLERRIIDAPPRQACAATATATDSAATEIRHELVVVDTRVADWQQLVDDIPRGGDRDVEVVLLDPARDGIEQIGAALAQRRGLDALHIVSHGEAGALEIGATHLDFSTLLIDATSVSGWRLALNDGADLMLYGCDLAASSDGRALVDALSRLTGADVAASVDTTGSASVGGDWVLEYTTGAIQSATLAGASGLASWNGSLALTPAGTETRANMTTGGAQTTDAAVRQVAIDAAGNFTIVWNDGNTGDVYGRRFDAAGVALSGEFRVNTTTANAQDRVTIGMDASGAFVVVWESANQDGNGLGIYAQRYNAAGVAQGGEFRVNQQTSSDQGQPSVAMDSAGDFIVTWTSKNQDGSGLGVYARRFDAAGNALGNEFRVNTTTASDQQHGSVACDDSGNFAVVWESANQDGNGLGIYGQRFNSAGVAQGAEFRVNTTTNADQDIPSVAMASTGDFLVTWSSQNQDGNGWGAYAQRYDAAGVAQGGELRVNTTTNSDQDFPIAAVDSQGNFLVSWESNGQDSGSTWGVYGRQYDKTGAALTGEVLINATISGDQDFPSMAWNGTQAVYAWEGNGTGDSDGIFFQRANVTAPGITVSPVSGSTTEASGTATFSVVLTSQPTASVTIPIASNDTAEGTVSVSSLTFTAANWNAAQVVTVTGVDDAVDDGDIAYSIVTGAAVSADANYSGLTVTDVSVTNIDDDTAGVGVSAIGGNTTEAGASATFGIVLISQPTADVTISITSNDTTEGTVSTPSLTFTAANWNVAQVAIVTGANDAVDDGDIAYSIVTGAAVSADGNYSGLNAADVAVINLDDDTAGISVSAISGSTTEAGGTASFTVALTSQPIADVSIALASSDTTECTVSVSSLTFTAADWNMARTITVTGMNDPDDDGDITFSIVTAAAASGDLGYDGRDAADVTVTNIDDDTAGVSVTPITGLQTTESGATAGFGVALTSRPASDVTIAVASSNTAEGTVSVSSLTFTSTNWNVAQQITVTGVNDAIDDGDIGYTIMTSAASSADAGYNGMAVADVAVTNIDSDTVGIVVSPISGNTTEAGASATFSVVLATQPTSDVAISIASSDAGEGTASAGSLVFTANSWNVAQIVTVIGVDDAVDDGERGYSVVVDVAVSADAGYNGLNAGDVAVTNLDDDTGAVVVSPITGNTTEAGDTATFTIVLASQPTADVTIALAASDSTEGAVSVPSVVFTAANWNIAQTVNVTGIDDAVDDGDVLSAVVTGPVTSGDSTYNGLNVGDVPVSNLDNDAAGVSVSVISGNTTEAGASATFTVVLTSQPAADVTISITSGDTTEGTVSTPSLTFTAADWNVAQLVNVSGVDDVLDDADVAYSIVTGAAVSVDAAYHGMAVGDVAATNVDDESAPVLALPASLQVNEDAPLRLGDAGLSVADTNGDLVRIDLSVADGRFDVNLAGGANIVAGSVGSRSLSLVGTQAQLDDALAQTTYRGDADWFGTDTLDISATDATGLRSSTSVVIEVAAVNDAPVVTSASQVDIQEGETRLIYITSTDVEADAPHYTIVGGADAAQFVIEGDSGELRLRNAPDAESPADSDRDNVYEVTVAASDGQGGVALQGLSVSVLGVNEAPSMSVSDLTVPAGGSVVLGTRQIVAHDVDSPSSLLTFAVSGVVNGHFELTSQPGVAIATFGESALEAGLVALVHDAGRSPPQFVIAVSDGQTTSAPLQVQAAVSSGQSTNRGAINQAASPDQTASPAPPFTARAEPASVPLAIESRADARVELPVAPRPASQIDEPAGIVRVVDSTARTFVFQQPASATRSSSEEDEPSWRAEDPRRTLLFALGDDARSSMGRDLQEPEKPRLSLAHEEEGAVNLELGAVVIQTLGIALTAGSVWWALRATGLVTALLASLPAWRQLDFLPVLADQEDDDRPRWSPAEDDESARDEAAVGRALFAEEGVRR